MSTGTRATRQEWELPKVLVAGDTVADEDVVVEEGVDLAEEGGAEFALEDVSSRNE